MPKKRPKPDIQFKQYYVNKEVSETGLKKAKVGDIVYVDPNIANPLVAAHILIPLASALRQKLYPPQSDQDKSKPVVTTAAKSKDDEPKVETQEVQPPPKPTTTPKKSTKKDSEPEDKVLIGNKLREAVQTKKTEAVKKEAEKKAAQEAKKAEEAAKKKAEEAKPSIDEDKLAAIKAGGKK